MASYIELHALLGDTDLLSRCMVAVVVAAEAVKDASLDAGIPDGTGYNTANHRLWARYALDTPKLEARKVLALLIADNRSTAATAIQNAADSTIQALVDELVPYLVQARADR